MARFFVEPEKIRAGEVIISGEDVKHITKVLRLGPGDEITVLDGLGQEYRVVIRITAAGEIRGEIVNEGPAAGEAPIRVTLVQGLPKGEKMELIIQKAVELGVARIIPVETARTIVRLEPKKAQQRRERWQRIALEAAKQSRRSIIPTVEPVADLAGVLARVPQGALVLMPWEEESQAFRAILTGFKEKQAALEKQGIPGEVYIIIGPEGGFTSQEAQMARAAGGLTLSLGPRILRTETAGLAALAVVMYELGDLGGVVDG